MKRSFKPRVNPRLKSSSRALLVLLAFAASTLAALPARAQFTGLPGAGKEVAITAPTPGKLDDKVPVIIPYAIMLLLAAAAIGANLIPSKRGHQD